MTAKKIGKRVFIYVRVSTAEQARDGYSVDEQIERLTNYCKAKGWTVIKVYTDPGFSGGDTDRPALQDMIRDIEAGHGDLVLVYKLDRLSRSQKDTLELIEDVFLANGCDFVSMNENFDTSTPFGKAMIGILAVFAQLEREQIKERMQMGKAGRTKEGKWHGGGRQPIGYDYIDGELVVNDYEAMQIREMHKLFQQGVGVRGIEGIFKEKGYTHKSGLWHTRTIGRVLKNDLYIGNVKFHGQTYQGMHTPIIDIETYEKTMSICQSHSKSGTKNYGHTAYLNGLIFCKRCTARYGYTAWDCKKRGIKYSYYACYSRRKTNRQMIKDPNCKNKNYRMEELDNIILTEIGKLATDPNYTHEIKKANEMPGEATKKAVLEKELSKIDSQRSKLMDLYTLGMFTIDELQQKAVPLNDRKKKLEAELLALTETELSEEDVQEIVSDFQDIIDRGNFEEIRLLINSLIDRIEIDGDDVFIHWKFA